jgi:hypothetical protein
LVYAFLVCLSCHLLLLIRLIRTAAATTVNAAAITATHAATAVTTTDAATTTAVAGAATVNIAIIAPSQMLANGKQTHCTTAMTIAMAMVMTMTIATMT